MQEPVHDLGARTTATSAAEGRLKEDISSSGGRNKIAKKIAKKYIKKAY